MGRKPVKILLVDDDGAGYVVAHHLVTGGQGEKYLLDWISDFDAASEAIQGCEHDVCLISQDLMGRSGLELIRQVHLRLIEVDVQEVGDCIWGIGLDKG